MGFLDKIFGDQKNKNDVQQISTLTPDQRSLLDNLTKLLGGQVGQGVPGYGGQTVADVNANQTDVFGNAGALSGIANKALGAGSSIMDYYDPAMMSRVGGQAESTLGDVLKKFDPTAANDAFTKGVQTPTIAAWERDVLPKIMERYAGANAGNSGAINRSMGRSGSDLMSNLGASRATNLYNQQNAYESRRLQGLGMAPSIAGMSNQNLSAAGQATSLGASALGTQLGIGGTQRGIEQESLNSLLSKYETQQAYNNPWLKYLPTALNTTAFTNVVTPQLSERQQMMNDIGLVSQIGMGTFGIAQGMGMGGAGGNAGGGFSTTASQPGNMPLNGGQAQGYIDYFMRPQY